MEPSASGSSKKTALRLAVVIVVLAVGISLVLQALRAFEDAAVIRRNEGYAQALLKTCCEAQDIYRRTDYDGDGVLEYAQAVIGDNSLYEHTAGTGDLTLIDLHGTGPFDASGGYKGERFMACRGKILTGQGPSAPGGAKSYLVDENMTEGYAFILWPRNYGHGVRRTFMISNDGRMYAKDLGPQSDEIASGIMVFDPDPTWELVE